MNLCVRYLVVHFLRACRSSPGNPLQSGIRWVSASITINTYDQRRPQTYTPTNAPLATSSHTAASPQDAVKLRVKPTVMYTKNNGVASNQRNVSSCFVEWTSVQRAAGVAGATVSPMQQRRASAMPYAAIHAPVSAARHPPPPLLHSAQSMILVGFMAVIYFLH
jgi:hypothetical protein